MPARESAGIRCRHPDPQGSQRSYDPVMSTIIDGGEVCAEIQQVGRFDYSISLRDGAETSSTQQWYRLGRARAERKASLELLRWVRRREWESGPVVVYRAAG